MFLIRKRLTQDEGSPPDTRYNPDCDCVETSVDGGITWTENPGADPRSNPAYQMPPNESPDPRCAAAAGMVAYIRQFVDQGIAGGTGLGIANGIFALILIFIPISWFFALITAIASLLLDIGSAALAFSFTEEIYDDLLCIFYARIDEDGVLTDAALADVFADVAALGDTVVTAAFGLAVQPMGPVGMTNAGVKLADPDAECACGWCFNVDLTLSDGGFTFTDAGEYSAGVGLIANDVVIGVARTLLMGEFVFGEDVFIDTITIVYDYHKATSSAGTEGVAVYSDYFVTLLYSEEQDDANVGDDLHINIDAGIPQPVVGLSVFFQPAFNANGGSATIKAVNITGTGAAPAWFGDNGWDAC